MAATELDTSPSESALNESLAVLSDEKRCVIVETLAEEDHSLDLSVLAGRVAAKIEETTVDAVGPRDVNRTEIELHHRHLPKLDDAGVVHYDAAEHRVVPAEKLADLSALLESR